MMKKIFAVLLTLLLLPHVAFAAEPADSVPEVHTVEKKTVPHIYVYREQDEPVEEEMHLYFVDGGDIPYVALSEYIPFLTRLLSTSYDFEIPMEISYSDVTGLYSVTRTDNKSSMIINPEADILAFLNYDSFLQAPGSGELISLLNLPSPLKKELDFSAFMEILNDNQEQLMGMSQEEQTKFFRSVLQDMIMDEPEKEHSFFAAIRIDNLNGTPISIELKNYGIEIIESEGECYLPFQLLNNFLVSPSYIHYIYNGQKVIGDIYSSKLDNVVYEAEPAPMSQEFAMFNFNMLCLFMDYFYGLKQEHHISSFLDYLMIDTGLMDSMISTDPEAFDCALTTLLQFYLDDGHSAFIKNSWRIPQDYSDPMAGLQKLFSLVDDLGYSNLRLQKVGSRLKDARKEAYPDGIPGYEEVEDTAFISFDQFTAKDDPADYYAVESFEDPQDTIELIMYAHQQITRENSPVKNIVLDLSLNGGGQVSAAVAVASWFTGNATVMLRDSLTGAQTIETLCADINLNGTIVADSGDNVADGSYNLYCLTSGQSFSCGNLLPAIFKDSGIVTLIGQRSGGGSNAVLPATTASGAFFRISGVKQLSTSINGSFYNIDTGIEPDVVLTKSSSYYDRQSLVELIHSLK